ncbi:hypothetical protein HAL013_02780 [Helicobacter ailurogastricus]|uniref:Uncharacterized protein n=1 Tax=Helicobacter ailurogastricus TaxID=1578720 RepID=A0A0K2X7V2_9HELI|nr:hypothetical protein HAL011_06650 [Helicobacter ailurogastricus]CRF42121.1 hypothetical protein HAL013_02780 [Helicobacter ailurogastricus]CRF44035.1 hypothetical protein HAL09_06030 [Helicobacter ailurogastricus]
MRFLWDTQTSASKRFEEIPTKIRQNMDTDLKITRNVLQ